MNLVVNTQDDMPNSDNLSMETLLITLGQEFVETHGYGKAGAYTAISVSDSGFDMDRKTQSHIFGPFFTTKEQGKGTGLGLSIAYGIVKKHHGFINLYSEPDTGTTFNICLPRLAATANVASRESDESFALPPDGTETIFVCEDDADLRKLMAKVLCHFGYRVIEAVDGQDAVEKFAAHGEIIDLAVIDVIMPKKNGREAYEEMAKLRPGLKTIFVSGYSRDIFEEGTMLSENTIFLHKPFSPDDLLIKVRETLKKR